MLLEFLFRPSTQKWGLRGTVRTGRRFTRRWLLGECKFFSVSPPVSRKWLLLVTPLVLTVYKHSRIIRNTNAVEKVVIVLERNLNMAAGQKASSCRHKVHSYVTGSQELPVQTK